MVKATLGRIKLNWDATVDRKNKLMGVDLHVHLQALYYRPNNSRGSRSMAGSGALSRPGFPINHVGGWRTGDSFCPVNWRWMFRQIWKSNCRCPQSPDFLPIMDYQFCKERRKWSRASVCVDGCLSVTAPGLGCVVSQFYFGKTRVFFSNDITIEITFKKTKTKKLLDKNMVYSVTLFTFINWARKYHCSDKYLPFNKFFWEPLLSQDL